MSDKQTKVRKYGSGSGRRGGKDEESDEDEEKQRKRISNIGKEIYEDSLLSNKKQKYIKTNEPKLDFLLELYKTNFYQYMSVLEYLPSMEILKLCQIQKKQKNLICDVRHTLTNTLLEQLAQAKIDNDETTIAELERKLIIKKLLNKKMDNFFKDKIKSINASDEEEDEEDDSKYILIEDHLLKKPAVINDLKYTSDDRKIIDASPIVISSLSIFNGEERNFFFNDDEDYKLYSKITTYFKIAIGKEDVDILSYDIYTGEGITGYTGGMVLQQYNDVNIVYSSSLKRMVQKQSYIAKVNNIIGNENTDDPKQLKKAWLRLTIPIINTSFDADGINNVNRSQQTIPFNRFLEEFLIRKVKYDKHMNTLLYSSSEMYKYVVDVILTHLKRRYAFLIHDAMDVNKHVFLQKDDEDIEADNYQNDECDDDLLHPNLLANNIDCISSLGLLIDFKKQELVVRTPPPSPQKKQSSDDDDFEMSSGKKINYLKEKFDKQKQTWQNETDNFATFIERKSPGTFTKEANERRGIRQQNFNKQQQIPQTIPNPFDKTITMAENQRQRNTMAKKTFKKYPTYYENSASDNQMQSYYYDEDNGSF